MVCSAGWAAYPEACVEVVLYNTVMFVLFFSFHYGFFTSLVSMIIFLPRINLAMQDQHKAMTGDYNGVGDD